MSRLSPELRARSKRFASRVIELYVSLPKQRREVEVLGGQLLRSGTSVAAQCREAARARSSSEFCSKLGSVLQEADESQLWLELLQEDCGIRNDAIHWLLGEVSELIAIFVTIINRTKGNEQ